MSRLLNTIVGAARERLEERRRRVPLAELRDRVADAEPVRSLIAALEQRPFSVIAEHKKRSPSGGQMLRGNLEHCLEVYAAEPWISAVSVLTDEDHFDGSLADLERARAVVGERPLLRKDFIVDEYQVWEARAAGADAILLMTAVHAHTRSAFAELFYLAKELGLDCLIELGMGDGDPEDLATMVPKEARLWGVNARAFEGSLGLRAFMSRQSVGLGGRDLTTSLARHDELFHLVPANAIAVAESGIQNSTDLIASAAKGYRAALVGTAFLKGPLDVSQVAAEFSRAFEADGTVLRSGRAPL